MALERYGLASAASNVGAITAFLGVAACAPAEHGLTFPIVGDTRRPLGLDLEVVRVRRGPPLDQLPEAVVEHLPQARVLEHDCPPRELELRVAGLCGDR